MKKHTCPLLVFFLLFFTIITCTPVFGSTGIITSFENYFYDFFSSGELGISYYFSASFYTPIADIPFFLNFNLISRNFTDQSVNITNDFQKDFFLSLSFYSKAFDFLSFKHHFYIDTGISMYNLYFEKFSSKINLYSSLFKNSDLISGYWLIVNNIFISHVFTLGFYLYPTENLKMKIQGYIDTDFIDLSYSISLMGILIFKTVNLYLSLGFSSGTYNAENWETPVLFDKDEVKGELFLTWKIIENILLGFKISSSYSPNNYKSFAYGITTAINFD